MKKVRKSLALLLTLAMVSTFVIPVAALPGETLGEINSLATYTSTVYTTALPYSGTTYLDGNGYTTPVAYTGVQNIQFDVTPLVDNCDGVIAYADADRLVGNFNDLAMLVRMSDTGIFDVRNGAPGNNTQQCLVEVPYTAGETYHIEIVSDIATMLYDVWVTTPDGTRTKIAEDYGYRTASQAFTNDVGQVFFATGTVGNEFQVKNHMIRPVINGTDVYNAEVYSTVPPPVGRTNANFLQGLGLVTDQAYTGVINIACDITPGAGAMDQNFGFADSNTLVKAFNDLAMQVRMIIKV